MNTTFSAAAGPQALGYLYQAQYALYALLTADGEDSALVLEGLDDMELQSATATELQQLKHHLSTKRQAVLSNRSPDWWKTLRVWGDLLQQQQWDPLRTRLALLTTATAAPGSIPRRLRDDAALGPRRRPEAAGRVSGHDHSQISRLCSDKIGSDNLLLSDLKT